MENLICEWGQVVDSSKILLGYAEIEITPKDPIHEWV